MFDFIYWEILLGACSERNEVLKDDIYATF